MVTNAELAKEVGDLRAEMAEMRESLKMFNEICEKVKTENESLVKENKLLKAENKELAKRMGDLEQYSRINNVEIRGVPFSEGESCLQVVQEIGNKVDCPVTATDIDVVHRVPAKNGTQHIIARFCSRTKKIEFASKARKARLTTAAIGIQSRTDKPIFVNDHLTPQNKRLFAQALTLKKEHSWKHLWTDNGAIKARKTDDSRVCRISGVGDLRFIS